MYAVRSTLRVVITYSYAVYVRGMIRGTVFDYFLFLRFHIRRFFDFMTLQIAPIKQPQT